MVIRATSEHAPGIKRLMSNMYGEYAAYGHITRDAHCYREYRVDQMLAEAQALSVVSECGHGLVLGCYYQPWYDPHFIGVEQLLYIHPDHRSLKLAKSMINGWVDFGVSEGISEFHAGNLTGHRPELLIRLYRQCGFNQQGLTLIKKV